MRFIKLLLPVFLFAIVTQLASSELAEDSYYIFFRHEVRGELQSSYSSFLMSIDADGSILSRPRQIVLPGTRQSFMSFSFIPLSQRQLVFWYIIPKWFAPQTLWKSDLDLRTLKTTGYGPTSLTGAREVRSTHRDKNNFLVFTDTHWNLRGVSIRSDRSIVRPSWLIARPPAEFERLERVAVSADGGGLTFRDDRDLYYQRLSASGRAVSKPVLLAGSTIGNSSVSNVLPGRQRLIVYRSYHTSGSCTFEKIKLLRIDSADGSKRGGPITLLHNPPNDTCSGYDLFGMDPAGKFMLYYVAPEYGPGQIRYQALTPIGEPKSKPVQLFKSNEYLHDFEFKQKR